jgi:hypothetical protein
VLTAICKPARRATTPSALYYDIERLINRYLLFADSPPSLSAIMGDIVLVLMRHGLQLRPQFTLAVKAMGQGEAIMRILMGDKPTDYILDVATPR